MKQLFIIALTLVATVSCSTQHDSSSKETSSQEATQQTSDITQMSLEKPHELFLKQLIKHKGKSYQGQITAGGKIGDGFTGEKLIMHVDKVEGNRVCVPFHVGENRSRVWILTLEGDRILLKHDHRHEDGTPDKVTMYGGWTTNHGTENIQVFPADQQTRDLIDYAAQNVWWMTINDSTFTYNLHRVGSDRLFSVSFDLTKPVETPPAAWGWEK